MQTRIPTLRRHARGCYFSRWAGKDHWFTTDEAESRRLFLDPASEHHGSLRRWQEWTTRAALLAPAPRQPKRRTVAQMADEFFAELHKHNRYDDLRYYRSSLRRFLHAAGRFPTDTVDEVLFESFSSDLRTLDLAAKTMRHDLNAAKRLWRWGSAPTRRLCPPLNLDMITSPRVRKTDPEPASVPELKRWIKVVTAAGHEVLADWLRFNYLTACRASEVVRAAHGQGKLIDLPRQGRRRAVPSAMLELKEHKTARRTERSRFIMLSDEAHEVFLRLKPLPLARARKPTRLTAPGVLQLSLRSNQYAERCRDAGVPGAPHRCRDSAATHLLERGVDQATVDVILGHEPTSELPRYAREGPRFLRETVSRLTLR